jgi:ribosomal protein L29
MMKELREKNDADLRKLLLEKRETLRAFRFGMAGSATRDTKAGKHAKREIARILTILSARAKTQKV